MATKLYLDIYVVLEEGEPARVGLRSWAAGAAVPKTLTQPVSLRDGADELTEVVGAWLHGQTSRWDAELPARLF